MMMDRKVSRKGAKTQRRSPGRNFASLRLCVRLIVASAMLFVPLSISAQNGDVAPLQPEPLRSQFANIRESLKDPGFAKALGSQREFNFLLRNTISITMLSGSKQTNVIPNAATCNLDVRLLPGESPDEFLKALTAVIADPTIKIENVNRFKPPNSSPTNTELFSLIARKSKENHPGTIVTTKMLSGYTESQLYRQLGIIAYGWAPIYTTPAEDEGVHGNNERITVKNVRQGTREFYEVVSDISR